MYIKRLWKSIRKRTENASSKNAIVLSDTGMSDAQEHIRIKTECSVLSDTEHSF